MDDLIGNILKPVRLSVSMGGSGPFPKLGPWPTSYVRRAVAQNIAIAAYEQPLTVAEISRKIDVPLHFVQEEVETLTDHELMRQVGSRYQTDFVILRHEAYKAQSDALAEVGSAIAQPLLRSIFALQDRIQAIEHYDAGKSFAEQLWTLVPFVFKETHLQSAIPVTDAMAVYPLRKDGSRWLVIGSETRDIKACGVSQNMCPGLRGKILLTIYNAKSVCDKAQYIRLPSSECVDLLYALATNGLGRLDSTDKQRELIDNLVEKNFLVRQGDAFRLNILYMDRSQYDALRQVTCPVIDAFGDRFARMRERVSTILRNVIPEHLAWQIDHYTDAMCADVVGYVMRTALQQGTLAPPEDPATAGVYLLERCK